MPPTNPQAYRHGQHPRARIDGTYGQCLDSAADDHHSPLTPTEYLGLRVQPQMRFYQRRMPGYYRARSILETILVLTTFTGTVLAFFRLSAWAAISAAIASAVTAYSKFLQPETKLTRYSDVVAGIRSVLLWWNSLTDVEQASQANTNALIKRCEFFFATERQAWVSTAIATVIAGGANEAAGGDEEKDGKRIDEATRRRKKPRDVDG